MSKMLKKELFNIYDIVIFEDENGITQDCVCSIRKDKEEGKIFEIECNSHVISIHENGSYRVFEKDGKDMTYYVTNKKIIHLYTLKNDNRFYEVYPTDDYESVDNVEPSEVLKCLECLYCESEDYKSNDRAKDYETIKQALQRLEKYEQILGNGRLTDRNYKNTTLDLDSCKPYLRLGQLEDIYEEGE